MILDVFFKNTHELDFFRLFCGVKLGAGMSREVWTFGLDDKYVIKFEQQGFFQNVKEWELWKDAEHGPAAKWLAPCDRISENGRILIMKRTVTASHRQYPSKMPAFLTDFKKENYGMLNGRLVCHDYGLSLVSNSGLTSRMKSVTWL